MEYTQNYALRKPGLNEYANVRDLNFNADKIDSQMRKNQDVDGEVYDPTTTSSNAYEAGDYVINPDDGLMYVCNETTYGPWDSTKWDHTTEFDEIQKAMASGGESELADLHDVDIDNPTNGQALLYDPTSLKWHNSDLPDADVTKEASGNPIELTDAASAPMVKCVTDIQGSQDLHGYDKPWVGGAGKNKFDAIGNTSTKVENGVNITLNSDGTVLINGTTTSVSQIYWTIPRDTARTYAGMILNGNIQQSGVAFGLELASSPYTNFASDTGSGSTISEEIANVTTFVNLILRISTNVTLNNALIKPMIRLSTEADSTFAPYSNICPITAYTEGEIEVRGKNIFDITNMTEGSPIAVVSGDTITNTSPTAWTAIRYINNLKPGSYTFSFNAITGTGILQLSRWSGSSYVPIVEFTQSSTTKYVNFTYTTNSRIRISIYPTVNNTTVSVKQIMLNVGSSAENYEPYVGTTHTTTYPSAIYRGSEDVVNGSVECDWPVIDLGDLTWGLSGNVWYATVNGIKRPAQTGYKLNAICSSYEVVAQSMAPQATHVCISGLNWIDGIAIWKSGFETAQEVKEAMVGVKFAYLLATPTTESITPTNLPIKSLSGYNHIESTTGDMEIEYFPAKEQPLIDLIPEASNMHEYSTAEHAVGTWVDGSTIYERSIDLGSFSIGSGGTYIIEEATDIDLLIDYDGYVIESSIMYALPDPSIRIKMESNKDLIFSGTANWDVTSGYLTIRYTKTSSNNRSLAKSAPQEETKEEQVEELKEEPTEEITEETKEEVKEEPEEEVEEVKEEVKEEETKEEGEVNER